MSIEEETRQNSTDIKDLTISVTRLATIVESSEKRHDSDMDIVKRMVLGLEGLTEKMSAIPLINEKLTTAMAGVDSQGTRLERMSVKIEAHSGKLEELGKQVVTTETKITALETWRNKWDGATGALKGIAYVLWAIFGTAIISVGYYLIQLFVQHGHLIAPITGE